MKFEIDNSGTEWENKELETNNKREKNTLFFWNNEKELNKYKCNLDKNGTIKNSCVLKIVKTIGNVKILQFSSSSSSSLFSIILS